MSKKQFNNILLNFSINQNVDEAVKEWEYFGHAMKQGDVYQCICGKIIHSCFYYQNRNTKKCIRVGNNCVDKFLFNKKGHAIKNKQAQKTWQDVMNKGIFKIEDIEEYEKVVREEMIKYYGIKVADALNDYQLEKIRKEVEELKEVDNINIIQDINSVIIKRKTEIYKKNKDAYLKRKQEWKDKGSLCCKCNNHIKLEKQIKYHYSTKKWYCQTCFETQD